MTPAVTAAEILKLLRARRLSRAEIAQELGIGADTAAIWCHELEENGVLVGSYGKTTRGQTTRMFTLAPHWGGQG